MKGIVRKRIWGGILAVAAGWLFVACGTAGHGDAQDGVRQSVYFWSTTFALNDAQTEFLRREHVGRLYLRYFDVVPDANGMAMPNATVRFRSQRPMGVEVVPTVYIVNECMAKDVGALDSLLLARIVQMNETHDIDSVREIQIDCDWTMRTRATFFSFLERLRTRAQKLGLTVSATIRLHQLTQPVPPVDRGVLMMYNTGDVTVLGNTNPILDMRDVEPYLRHLGRYDLPLATAYPVFSWRVVFRRGRFVGILHADDDLPVLPGDTLVEQAAPLATVLAAREAVGRVRPDANDEVILYDLSETNIERINSEHYEKVFGH